MVLKLAYLSICLQTGIFGDFFKVLGKSTYVCTCVLLINIFACINCSIATRLPEHTTQLKGTLHHTGPFWRLVLAAAVYSSSASLACALIDYLLIIGNLSINLLSFKRFCAQKHVKYSGKNRSM